jgi:hypothetical protein
VKANIVDPADIDDGIVAEGEEIMANLGIGAQPPTRRTKDSGVKAPIGASKVDLERIELDKWKEDAKKVREEDPIGIDNDTPGDMVMPKGDNHFDHQIANSKSVRPGELTQIPKSIN